MLQVKTLNDCEATVLLNVYIYLVFVGNGWLVLVPSHLPHLKRLCLEGCSVCDKDVEELKAVVPELECTDSKVDLFRMRKCGLFSFELLSGWFGRSSISDIFCVSF